jgi:hypothetical protein
MEIGYTDQ